LIFYINKDQFTAQLIIPGVLENKTMISIITEKRPAIKSQ